VRAHAHPSKSFFVLDQTNGTEPNSLFDLASNILKLFDGRGVEDHGRIQPRGPSAHSGCELDSICGCDESPVCSCCCLGARLAKRLELSGGVDTPRKAAIVIHLRYEAHVERQWECVRRMRVNVWAAGGRGGGSIRCSVGEDERSSVQWSGDGGSCSSSDRRSGGWWLVAVKLYLIDKGKSRNNMTMSGAIMTHGHWWCLVLW
jgi:hypothetical protein